VYPQDNAPGSWQPNNQQPNPHDPYQQPYPQDPYQQPYPQDPYQQQHPPGQYQQPYPQDPYQQPYPQDPYQQQQHPYGYPGQPLPGYGAPQRPQRSRTPLIIGGAVLGIIVLICAAAVLIVQLGGSPDDDTSNRANPSTTSQQPKSSAPATSTPTTKPTPTGTGSPTEESIEGDLSGFKVGDCLTITGADNTVKPASCTASGAYKVLLRRDGTTDEKVCDGTKATDILYQDATGTDKDLVLCVALAK